MVESSHSRHCLPQKNAAARISQPSAMDLARALTNRRRQGSESNHNYVGPARAGSTRTGPIKRSAISNPVELISTTNVLAYNAPNIYGSSDESDGSNSLAASSRATTPETSPDESPLEPNHLSCYFPQRRNTTRTSKDSIDSESPKIPTRAPSHTKKTHQAIARKRASSRATQPPTAIHALQTPHEDLATQNAHYDHPFGAEIAQVNEVAEKFGTREAMILDEEEQFLMNHGLCKFQAEDYVDEIQSLFGGSYNNPFSPYAPVWI